MMPKVNVLCGFLLLFLFSGCVFHADSEPTPMATESEICDNQSLQPGMDGTPGWTLFEITVGKSTLSDLILQQGEPFSQQPFFLNGQSSGCIIQYQASNPSPLNGGAILYYLDTGRVRAIEIISPAIFDQADIPSNLGRAVTIYGKPTMVGYNKLYGSLSRTIIWLDKGVEIVAAIGPDSTVGGTLVVDLDKVEIITIRFSSPMTMQEYLASSLSSWYSEIQPESDVVDVFPRDPFNWNR